MPNTLEYSKIFQPALDKQIVQESTTGWMEVNSKLVQYNGGNEVKLPSIVMDGLADYDRDTGYVNGAVTLKWETYKLTQDRGRKFQLDAMDVNETNFVATAGTIMGEFQRTLVVPEIDAYRYSAIASKAIGVEQNRAATITDTNILTELLKDIAKVKEVVGNTSKLKIVMSETMLINLGLDEKAAKRMSTVNNAAAGGNKVTIEQNYRVIEIDGVFTPAVGQKILESQTAKLETNVKELTAENIRLSINGKIADSDGVDAPTGYKVISGKAKLENTDYIKNLGIVGTMSGTDDPIIIIIDNALCTSGLDFETKDNDEAVISMTFEAHANEGQVDDLSLPCRIYFPNIN